MTSRRKDIVCNVAEPGANYLRLITLHTLKRWKKKVHRLGFLTLAELRQASEDLQEDVLDVLKTLK